MGLIEFFFLCIVVGLLVYLINTFLPLPSPIKQLILIAAIIVLVLVLLRALGVLGHDVQIPQLR